MNPHPRRHWLGLLLAALVAACGRKGDLEPPPEDDDTEEAAP